MKATVNAKELKDAVTWTSKVIRGRPSLPILECVLLSAPYGRLTTRATNLEINLARRIGADVQETGEVAINAKSLKDYLRGIKGKNALSIEMVTEPVKGLRFQVDGEASGMIFARLSNPDDYPLASADGGWHNAISLDPKEAMLKEIAEFADNDTDSNRVVLKCIFIETYENGEYKMTAADGFRLVSVGIAQGEAQDSYLLPAQAAKMIATLGKGILKLRPESGKSQISPDHLWAMAEFVTENSEIQSRLEEGRFPDYNQIIPASDRGTWVAFDTAQLKAALESMVTVTNATKRYRERSTMLDLSTSHATLYATSESGNEITTELAANWAGEELVTGFNAKYLLDCLPFCGEQTRIMLENPDRPLMVKGIDSVMVVMPMHIK